MDVFPAPAAPSRRHCNFRLTFGGGFRDGFCWDAEFVLLLQRDFRERPLILLLRFLLDDDV